MSEYKFVKFVLAAFLLLIPGIAAFNYLVDPYNFYGNNLLHTKKTQEVNQLRLSKAIKTKKLKPTSIILGTSRAEFGYDPEHEYFIQPAYNLATGGSSMYELTRYLEFAMEQGKLKNVLLIADYINFNSNQQQKIADFDDYFGDVNLYKYLISINTLKDSILTIYGERQERITLYNENGNGQRDKTYYSKNFKKFGGQLGVIYRQSTYFNGFDNNDIYRDSGRSSFDDFRDFLELCYDNGITLDIVFGPNHVLHWEAFDFSIGLEKWYKWKEDIVATVEQVASEYEEKPFRVVDFAVYNEFTVEKLPEDMSTEMLFHWELNHYKSELGDLVLDQLSTNEIVSGVELNSLNIEDHLLEQKQQRMKTIDTEGYRTQVLVGRNRVPLNQFVKQR